MTKTIKEINTFINQLDKRWVNFNGDHSNYMSDFLDDDFLIKLDQQDPAKCFKDIQEELDNLNFFNVEFIYNYDAMKYLTENDQSLLKSISIAEDCGYNLSDIDSVLLAEGLLSSNLKETFSYLKDQIIEFFQD